MDKRADRLLKAVEEFSTVAGLKPSEQGFTVNGYRVTSTAKLRSSLSEGV